MEGLEGTLIGRDFDWKGWKGLRLEVTLEDNDWMGWKGLRLEGLEGTPVGWDLGLGLGRRLDGTWGWGKVAGWKG